MVEATVTYVICPSVPTEDPVRLLHEVLFQVEDLLANRGLVFRACVNYFPGDIPACPGTFHFCDPLIEGGHCIRCKAVAAEAFLHQALNTLPDPCCSEHQSETVLSIVFKE